MIRESMDIFIQPVKSYDVYERITFLDQSIDKVYNSKASVLKSSNQKGGKNKDNKSTTTVKSNDESVSPANKPLFCDLTLGMRLFNAYCVGQREK